MKPYTWQKAIADAQCEPLTKLLCYTISNYLSPGGDYAYPSIQTLCDATGLKKTAVLVHIKKAVASGLLVKEARQNSRGGDTSNAYFPNMPDLLLHTPRVRGDEPPRVRGDEPLLTDHLEQTTRKEPIILPSYINIESFKSFEGYRKELKKPLTNIAKKRLIEKLATMHDKGHDVNAMLMEAIDRGWLTIYEPRPQKQVQPAKPVPWYERETTGKNVEK